MIKSIVKLKNGKIVRKEPVIAYKYLGGSVFGLEGKCYDH
jgi:hypothetical protein